MPAVRIAIRCGAIPWCDTDSIAQTKRTSWTLIRLFSIRMGQAEVTQALTGSLGDQAHRTVSRKWKCRPSARGSLNERIICLQSSPFGYSFHSPIPVNRKQSLGNLWVSLLLRRLASIRLLRTVTRTTNSRTLSRRVSNVSRNSPSHDAIEPSLWQSMTHPTRKSSRPLPMRSNRSNKDSVNS